MRHHPLVSHLGMLQSHVVDEELEFAESQIEEAKIKAIYDMTDQYQSHTATNIDENVFYHPEDTLLLYPSLLGNSVATFLESNDIHSFLLTSHTRLSFIGTIETDFLQLKQARQLFLNATDDIGYNEAYSVDQASFTEVIQALFWIIRCDATIPYVLIQPDQSAYFFSICKYGNLHVYTPQESKSSLLNDLTACGLLNWRGNEYERFSSSGAIEERFTSPEK